MAAVILQLAEPRIHGAWGHTRFRADPVGRLRRTAHAAMVTVYGPRSAAETMIAAVCRRHESVRGVTPAGEAYSASDPDLLNWVQATVSFGMTEAHQRFIGTSSESERDRFHAEGAAIGRLYGAPSAPRTAAEGAALFRAMGGRLEPNDAIPELLGVLRRAPILPPPFGVVQGLMIRGAVELIPPELRRRLGLDRGYELPRSGAVVLRQPRPARRPRRDRHVAGGRGLPAPGVARRLSRADQPPVLVRSCRASWAAPPRPSRPRRRGSRRGRWQTRRAAYSSKRVRSDSSPAWTTHSSAKAVVSPLPSAGTPRASTWVGK